MPSLVPHSVLAKLVGKAPLKAVVVSAVLPPPAASADKFDVVLSQNRLLATMRKGPLLPDAKPLLTLPNTAPL